MEMLQDTYDWSSEHYIYASFLVMVYLFFHFMFILPLLLILYYRTQGISKWKFFPVLGPAFLDAIKDRKENNDIIFSQKMVHYGDKVIRAKITNSFSKVLITLYDPTLIKEFYINKNEFYEKAKIGHRVAKTLYGEGLIFQEGSKLLHHRKVLAKLFSFDYINKQQKLITTITDEYLQEIDCLNPTDLLDIFQSIVGEISLSVFFGRPIDDEKLYGKRLSEVLLEISKDTLKVLLNPLNLLTGGRILPKSFKQRSSDTRAAFMSLVRDDIMKDGDSKSLVKQFAKEENYVTGEPESALVEEITNQILNFYLGGKDNTSHLVVMIIYYLCEYREIKLLVLAEINHLLKVDEIKWDDLKNLPYLDAVIKETQRMYGPVISLVPRVAKKSHKLDDIRILKGTLVTVGIASNHHNPKYYPDPLYFNPDRWLQKSVDAQFSFLPFSAGPRNCIGKHLSNIITKTILIRLISRFDIIVDPNYTLSLEMTTIYTPRQPMNFKLLPKRR